MRVLVVDDSMTLRIKLSQILSEDGIEVLQAADARRGAKALEKNPDVAVLFLDVDMPGAGGLDLLKELRLQPRWDGLPVVMLGSECDQLQLQRAVEAGANEQLLKPFDAAGLRLKVDSLGLVMKAA